MNLKLSTVLFNDINGTKEFNSFNQFINEFKPNYNHIQLNLLKDNNIISLKINYNKHIEICGKLESVQDFKELYAILKAINNALNI